MHAQEIAGPTYVVQYTLQFSVRAGSVTYMCIKDYS